MDQDNKPLALVWICDGDLSGILHAARCLSTARELRKMGVQVTQIAPGAPGGPRAVAGEVVYFIPQPNVYLLRQVIFHLRLIWHLLRQWRDIDILLFHQMSAFWLLPLRFVRVLTRRRRPLLVMDTRTLQMAPPSKETLKDKLRKAFRAYVERAGNRWADGRTAITQRMVEAVHVPPERLWGVWPSGVDLTHFADAPAARRWPAPGAPLHLIYIGCMHYERNLMTLSKAVLRANAEGMHFVLTLIGDGTERADLEAFAPQTDGQVRVLPPVPHAALSGVLAEAHVGVLAFPDELKFQVSSPIKLFEYMAAGLPIMATQIACHTDVIGDGGYVFWAKGAGEDELLAALRLAWTERAALPEMGRRALEAAPAWTWQASAQKLKAALEYGWGRNQ